MASVNNDLFQEFIRTFIKKVQVLVIPAAPALVAEARDNINRHFKPWNPDLYYYHSYMECYYFCQQYEDYFKIAGLLVHKRVPFAIGFLKYHILN